MRMRQRAFDKTVLLYISRQRKDIAFSFFLGCLTWLNLTIRIKCKWKGRCATTGVNCFEHVIPSVNLLSSSPFAKWSRKRRLTSMKRLGSRDLMLFALPFVLLAVGASRSSRGLRMDQNETVFTCELTRHIPVETPVTHAVRFLHNAGFSDGALHHDFSGAKPHELGFTESQMVFPEMRDGHVWTVWLTVRNSRVQKVEGLFTYASGR